MIIHEGWRAAVLQTEEFRLDVRPLADAMQVMVRGAAAHPLAHDGDGRTVRQRWQIGGELVELTAERHGSDWDVRATLERG